MAGGKASRFLTRVEKAVLEVRGRTLLERSLVAFQEGGVDETLIAVTSRVPKTKELARKLGAIIIQTKGESYHEDVLELLDLYPRFLSLNVDVPFINGTQVRRFATSSEPESVAAIVPASLALMKPSGDSILIDDKGNRMIWVGMNLVTPSAEMKLVVINDPLLTININNERDLAFARKFADENGL